MLHSASSWSRYAALQPVAACDGWAARECSSTYIKCTHVPPDRFPTGITAPRLEEEREVDGREEVDGRDEGMVAVLALSFSIP